MAEEKFNIQLDTFYFFRGGQLCFWKWLPLTKEQALKFTKNSISYEVYVDPDYTDTFLFKPDLAKISHGNAWVQALKVVVEFYVNAEVKRAIEEHNPPAELISDIAPFFSILEDSIRDIVRNDLGQYWVSHPYHDPEENDRDILMGLHYSNPTSKKWEQFLYGGTIRLSSPIPDEQILIDKNKWEQLGRLIDTRYRSDLALVCLSNAYSLIREKNNYRLALIEAVISLERAIFVYLDQYIPESEKEKARPFFNGESVKDTVDNLLPIVSERLEIGPDLIRLCSEAIEVRNLIIHRTQFRCDPVRINQYLDCIGIIVRKLVPHHF